MKINKPNEQQQILLLVLYFPLSILAIEILAHLSIGSGLLLLLRNPFAFLMNTIVLAVISYFLLSIIRHQKVVFTLITLISFLLGLATKLKIDFRGVGLNVLDLLIVKEAGEMTNNLSASFLIKSGILVFLLSMLFAYLIRHMITVHLSSKFRKNGVLAFLLLMLFLYFLGPYTITIKSAGIKRKLYIEESGSLYYFAAQIQNTTTLHTPKEAAVHDAFDRILEAYQPSSDTIIPDIIVIQSESFTDPTRLGMENFSEDPLPYFHQLQQQSNAFDITVPSFAGGTANSEYEVVTGMSTLFYPSDATVYANYLVKPTISLGSILSVNGYSTTLLHPFHSTFYRRDNAYRLLGFDRFYGLEYLSHVKAVDDDLRYWNAVDDYMTDADLYDRILAELDMDYGKENHFVFGVTMQNHTPFVTPTGVTSDIRYIGGQLENEEKVQLYNTYLNNLKASDDALKSLITALSQRKQPTIVLFYGDHYPKIGQDGNAYTDLGLVPNLTTAQNDYIIHQTPAFIWSNYKDAGKTIGPVDASLVPAKLLGMTGVEVPNYMKVLSYLNGLQINAMTNAYLVQEGVLYGSETAEYRRIHSLYALLNGDILGPNRFLETKEWIPEENKTYLNPQN